MEGLTKEGSWGKESMKGMEWKEKNEKKSYVTKRNEKSGKVKGK